MRGKKKFDFKIKPMKIKGSGKGPISREICKGNIGGLVVPKIRTKWR